MNMDQGTTDGQSYFGTVARTYDRLQPIVAGRSYAEALEVIVDLIPHGPDDSFEFTELGCGTAEPSMRVLKRFPRARGTCIDAEPAMLEIAKRKLAPMAPRTEIWAADILTCELPSCDVVLSAKAFHHIPTAALPPLLVRIVRALRASGCFILYDHMTVGPPWGPQTGEQSRRMYRRHVEAAVAAGQATEQEVAAWWALKKHMQAAGKDVEYRVWSAPLSDPESRPFSRSI
jgi:tRNA (cmo5U34)-methyltransferase